MIRSSTYILSTITCCPAFALGSMLIVLVYFLFHVELLAVLDVYSFLLVVAVGNTTIKSVDFGVVIVTKCNRAYRSLVFGIQVLLHYAYTSGSHPRHTFILSTPHGQCHSQVQSLPIAHLP